MKIPFFLFAALLPLYAQQNPGAKQIALSNSDVALSNNVFALFNNPAGLAHLYRREAGVFYSPSPYGLKELSNASAAYNEPMELGAVSAGIMTYGFDLYRENNICFAAAFNYKNNLLAGATINYRNISIKNYGSSGTFLLNIGIISIVSKFLRIGFSVHNITHSSFGSGRDELPVYYRAGLCCKMDKRLTLLFAIEKDIRYKISPRFGLDYVIIKYLSLRTGFSKEPSEYSFGAGIRYSIFDFNYAFFTHSELGFTQQAGIVIKFKD